MTLKLNVPFRISYGVTEERRSFWLRLDDDAGWGEGTAPPYYGIPEADMLRYWEESGKNEAPWPDDVAGIPARVGTAGPGPARCALDMALHDRIARQKGVPLYELLDLPNPGTVPVTMTIPIDEPGEMAKRAERVKEHSLLKIKLGSEDDVSRVAAVRKARPDARIIVDANAGWTPDEAVENIKGLVELGVEMVEQPVAKDDFDGMGEVQSRVGVPIVGDESVQSMEDVERLAELGVQGINLKLTKIGGLANCNAMVKRGRELGLRIMLGCMIESSLGVTAMAHFAGLADWVDLDSPMMVKNDPFDGLIYENGTFRLPDRPGIGAILRQG